VRVLPGGTMSGPVIMKFGGTSVANASAIRRVSGIVANSTNAGSPVVVVVSAMAGVTDTLVSACDAARSGAADDLARILAALRTRHIEVVEQLAQSSAVDASLRTSIDAECDRLHRALVSSTGGRELSGADTDAVLASGELMSSRLVAAALAAIEVAAAWVDSRQVVVTSDSFGAALPLAETTEAARREINPVLQSGAVAVVPGYVGATHAGVTTTLGRNGSDISASIIGAALDATEIQIWTDVDGMLTGDPRIIDGVRPIERLSFEEASELAYFGAKVLHPGTIRPAVEKNIPVRILNTMRPEKVGSLITADPVRPDSRLTALACKRNITLITITSTRLLLPHEFLRRVFEVFERHVTPVDVVTISEVSLSMTVADGSRVDAISTELTEFATVQVDRGMATISAVGDRLRMDPSIALAAIVSLGQFPLRMIAHGASRRNVTVVLSDDDVPAAMRRLHDEFFTVVGARP
jgi:aspartate kinase